MDSGLARTRSARSWSPQKNRAVVSKEDGDLKLLGAHDSTVPDLGFGLTDFNRPKEYPRVGEREDSIPDLGFGLRCLSAGPRRSRAGPRVGEDDSAVPDLGFGLRHGGSGEGSPKSTPAGGKKPVEEVIVPKRAYTLGSAAGASRPVAHIKTRDAEIFLSELKTSVDAVRQTANERRVSGAGTAKSATVDGSTSPSRQASAAGYKSSPPAGGDGYSTDECSDDDFDQDAGLEKVETSATSVKRAIEEMESQLPKLPKINKFLKSMAVSTVETASPAAESEMETSVRPAIYDCLVQTADALQSMASAILEEGAKLDVSNTLDRARADDSSAKDDAHLCFELGVQLARAEQQTRLTTETKEALAALQTALTPVLVSMSPEQRKGMLEILNEAKSDYQLLERQEGKLESIQAELRRALDAVTKAAKARKTSTASVKSAADLEREVQSLRQLLEGKESVVKELQSEIKTLKDQQVSRPTSDKEKKEEKPTSPPSASKVGSLSAKGVVLTPKTIPGTGRAAGVKKAPVASTSSHNAPPVGSKGKTTSPTKSVKLSDLPTAKTGGK